MCVTKHTDKIQARARRPWYVLCVYVCVCVCVCAGSSFFLLEDCLPAATDLIKNRCLEDMYDPWLLTSTQSVGDILEAFTSICGNGLSLFSFRTNQNVADLCIDVISNLC